jgi:hypothetical protein
MNLNGEQQSVAAPFFAWDMASFELCGGADVDGQQEWPRCNVVAGWEIHQPEWVYNGDKMGI